MEAVDAYCGCLDDLRDDGEMVEALLDEEADDAIGVEEEVASAGVLVADDGEEGLELRGLWEREDGRWERGGIRLRGRCVMEDHGGEEDE